MPDALDEYKDEQRKRRGYSESHFSSMKRRLNLQSIGRFLRDGDESIVDYDSFVDRENNAYRQIESYMTEKCGEEAATDILEHVTVYSSIIEEIAFSLGLKAGATLLCKLTDNFETDV